jgi:hypothetical protein
LAFAGDFTPLLAKHTPNSQPRGHPLGWRGPDAPDRRWKLSRPCLVVAVVGLISYVFECGSLQTLTAYCVQLLDNNPLKFRQGLLDIQVNAVDEERGCTQNAGALPITKILFDLWVEFSTAEARTEFSLINA